jgi:Protein of unknown function (DUF2569)
MTIRWNEVPVEEAHRHPLFGVRGWLLVFAVGLVLGLLKELGALAGEAGKAGMSLGEFLSLDHPAISYAKLAIGLQTSTVVVIYWLLLSKNPSFRNAASALLLANWPVAALIGLAYPFPGLGNALAQTLILWAVSCAVWVTYLQRSKRVRVTFENRVSVSTADEGASSAPNPAVAVSEPTLVAATQPNSRARVADSRPSAALPTPSEEFWAAALAEFESVKRRPGLWAQVFAEAKGEEAVAKAAYLSRRAAELHEEHANRVAAAERDERERAREAELATLSEEQRAYERLPKGSCPNCDSTIPMSSLTCPKCGAMFGKGSAWHVVPLESK